MLFEFCLVSVSSMSCQNTIFFPGSEQFSIKLAKFYIVITSWFSSCYWYLLLIWLIWEISVLLERKRRFKDSIRSLCASIFFPLLSPATCFPSEWETIWNWTAVQYAVLQILPWGPGRGGWVSAFFWSLKEFWILNQGCLYFRACALHFIKMKLSSLFVSLLRC